LLDEEGIVGGGFDPLADTVAVHRSPGERLEDEEIEGGAEQVGFGVGHSSPLVTPGKMKWFPSAHKGSDCVIPRDDGRGRSTPRDAGAGASRSHPANRSGVGETAKASRKGPGAARAGDA